MNMEFKKRYGPWALIAGASEGTGACYAEQLADIGLNLILVARREGPLAALADEIRAEHGVECITASVDLAREDATDRLVAATGGRDVGLLVLNAGADPNGSMFLDNNLGNWDDLAMRNVMQVMRSCHVFGRTMRERGGGGIIIANSGACYGGIPGIGVYCATKAFDLVLGEALWAEFKPYGIDVLNLVMGQTDTPAYRELMEKMHQPFPAEACASPADVVRLALERLPQGPVLNWGLADEESGYAGTSAAQRRARVEMIAGMAAKQAESQPS
jgi:short-subunit dehydrogenase